MRELGAGFRIDDTYGVWRVPKYVLGPRRHFSTSFFLILFRLCDVFSKDFKQIGQPRTSSPFLHPPRRTGSSVPCTTGGTADACSTASLSCGLRWFGRAPPRRLKVDERQGALGRCALCMGFDVPRVTESYDSLAAMGRRALRRLHRSIVRLYQHSSSVFVSQDKFTRLG